MRVAVIGAGLAGLSVTYHLQSLGAFVTLFDVCGIGAGASGVASGLVHPYVGEQVRRSLMANESMLALDELLHIAEKYSQHPFVVRTGIERIAQTPEQHNQLLGYCDSEDDVKHLHGDHFLITSGLTIHTETYLKALWQASFALGAQFEKRKVDDPLSLKGFDAVVIAAGAGSLQFTSLKKARLGATRGQLLLCSAEDPALKLPRSLVGKGYIASSMSPVDSLVTVGSTYERGRIDDIPDRAYAEAHILPMAQKLAPHLTLKTAKVRAGVRLTPRGHYLPLAGRLEGPLWVMTGFGSRGLLYHALWGKTLARAIFHDDESLLPEPFLRQLSIITENSYSLDPKSVRQGAV